MLNLLQRLFGLHEHGTTLKTEVMAGMTSFFTIVYIVAVNSAILADAGIPVAGGVLATVLTACFGCLVMGLYANAPLMLVPGMGVNAFFTYTIVQSMGLSWQEGLAAVFLSGVLFAVTAFTRLAGWLSEAIPQSITEAITVGIGLLLTFIGLQKGGLVAASPTTFVTMGDLKSPQALVTILTLLVTLVLFMRQVKGAFLISILAGTGLAAMFGLVHTGSTAQSSASIFDGVAVIGALSFGKVSSLSFWMATFSLTMILVFENMGLLHGFVPEHKFTRSFRANAISVISSGFFGTSPTVTTVENAAGLAAGGKTGLTAITAGGLFLLSLCFLPFIQLIPSCAIAPVLIVIGGLMIQNVQNIQFQDISEGFPAFLILVLIPLTYSIADGIAFGFIAYPILKLALGRAREIRLPVVVIAGLFLVNLVLNAIGV
ncbi:NCS2 family permease [Tumebacillus permanentifrigoris]|uniref:AGZA family xanthine/uracil permease-like MFS transporter n=1 Tax=Tumebacillus permanentifrigoris TaxID=378543 RepID=A0A316D5T9_9BACL|nr:NCS2 family permease [Tumebacillus permanentifrigoris]PWK06657.1 AGZA family xanthine/uracil permease-like MFS transporter [Tumebacillus permanentifrigoris]